MEKYCVKCRESFDDMKYTICPYCKGELIEREIGRPPLGKLRHEILVRDGYRCRECGKSNKEASLEIDHIYPWSKGGLTTEENLWTLCRECNQAKRDYVWKDKEIEITRNALSNLENQLHEAEGNLKFAETEEDEYALKAKIKDFKKNKIPEEEEKLNRLMQEEEKINAERKAQQNENIRRKNLYNKLFVILEDKLLLEVFDHFSLTEESDEDNIRLLIDKHNENEIFSTIDSIKNKIAEEEAREKSFKKLSNTLSDDELELFMRKYSLKGSKSNVINYLIDNYTEDEIDSMKIKLVKEEEKRVEKERRKKLCDKLHNTLSDDDIILFKNEFSLEKSKSEIITYLMDNYTEDKIESIRIKLVKEEEERVEEERKRKLFDKLSNTLSEDEIKLFRKELSLEDSKSELINYLINNYSEDEIDSIKVELVKKEQNALEEKERQINDLRTTLDFKIMNYACEKFNIPKKNYVDDFIKELKPLPHEKVDAIYKYICEFY